MMATRTESPEIRTVRGKFAIVCGSISAPDVVNFAGELLQSNLISDAGHQAAIAAVGHRFITDCSSGLRSREQCLQFTRQLLQVRLYRREQERTTCFHPQESIHAACGTSKYI